MGRYNRSSKLRYSKINKKTSRKLKGLSKRRNSKRRNSKRRNSKKIYIGGAMEEPMVGDMDMGTIAKLIFENSKLIRAQQQTIDQLTVRLNIIEKKKLDARVSALEKEVPTKSKKRGKWGFRRKSSN